tara:strand:+ start:83 stop:424 length:342 start_codon:yes stop_codon:yes gene_type:complete
MADERPQSDGAIYQNNYKKTDKQPDWTGKLEIHKDTLKELVEKVRGGEQAELRVALWDRTSKNGNDYKYARLDIPMKPKTETRSEEPQFNTEEPKDNRPPSVLDMDNDIDVPF